MTYIKSLVYIILIILVLTFISTILHHFNVISGNLMAILKLVIPILALFYGGIYIGKNSIEKGYIEGLKIGILFSLILLIISFFLPGSIKFINQIIYFLIILGSSMFGGMIGINKSKKITTNE